MREIKFRAWDREKKHMFFDLRGIVSLFRLLLPRFVLPYVSRRKECFESFLEKKGCELMQYTGIKDKNEKEIYECDVIQITWLYKGKIERRIGEIRWNSPYTCWMIHWMYDSSGEVLGEQILGTQNGRPLEYSLDIIGNIYENPELIK